MPAPPSRLLLLIAALSISAIPPSSAASVNSTASWLGKRAALIDKVFGLGPGVLPSQSKPDDILRWPDTDPGLQGLVWNLTTFFPINATVFYSPLDPSGKTRSKNAIFFHHGHSNCVCDGPEGDAIAAAKCRPGCNSSMPSYHQLEPPLAASYNWWDLYNVSTFFKGLGYDVFIFSMPLKGINLGPGSTKASLNTNHWWFYQWEKKGDTPLRYFVEPVVLTANYATEHLGYESIYMAGLSGGGWSTTLAPAIEKRIKGSFPIAGSVPCAMRNPTGLVPGQKWTGDDDEDYEQSCMPPDAPAKGGDDMPGRPAFTACNYTCQYLLAGLEPGRYQVQILHEYDSCCFSPHGRHDQMLAYEHNVRAELQAPGSDRAGGRHGWFTSTANAHVKHEVSEQDKTLIRNALAGEFAPASGGWDRLPCDILHQPAPGGACAADWEPGCKNASLDPMNPQCR